MSWWRTHTASWHRSEVTTQAVRVRISTVSSRHVEQALLSEGGLNAAAAGVQALTCACNDLLTSAGVVQVLVASLQDLARHLKRNGFSALNVSVV